MRSAAPSPTVRRRRLVSELRRLRDVRGLTIDEVALEIGVSKSALSRIENGHSTLKLPVLRSLLGVYGVSGEAATVLEQLTREAAQRGWWQTLGTDEVLDATKTLAGLEAEAEWINEFSSTMVAGLLQTREYASSVLRALMPNPTDERVQGALDFRERRQERVGDFRLWVIVAEEAVRRPIGGAAVMRAQVEHLLAVSDRRMTTVQVLGRETGEHAGLSGPFKVLGFPSASDPHAVYLEGNYWDACIEDEKTVSIYERAFERLRADALSLEDSVTRLHQISKEYE